MVRPRGPRSASHARPSRCSHSSPRRLRRLSGSLLPPTSRKKKPRSSRRRDTLIEASHGAKLAAPQRRITTEVLDITGETASACVFTAEFNDYLHLVKRAGSWQILNVLWHRPPSPLPAPGDGREAVAQAVKDYAAAMYAADADRVQSLVHPLAHLRVFGLAPQSRPRVVREQNTETLVAALAAGQVKLGGKAEDSEITVYGVDGDIASGRLTMDRMPAYLHLAPRRERPALSARAAGLADSRALSHWTAKRGRVISRRPRPPGFTV